MAEKRWGATSATMAGASSAAMDSNRPSEILTMFPSALEAAMAPRPTAEGRVAYCPVAQRDFRIRLLKSLRWKPGSL